LFLWDFLVIILSITFYFSSLWIRLLLKDGAVGSLWSSEQGSQRLASKRKGLLGFVSAFPPTSSNKSSLLFITALKQLFILRFTSSLLPSTTMSETPELQAQNEKFGYKAPESVYKKHEPTLTEQGRFILSTSLTFPRPRRIRWWTVCHLFDLDSL